MIIEIPGEKSAEKTDQLADRLRELFPNGGEVKIACLTKMTEVRISGLGHPGRDGVSSGHSGRLRHLRDQGWRGPTPHADKYGDRVSNVPGHSDEENYSHGKDTHGLGIGESIGAQHPPYNASDAWRATWHNAPHRTQAAAEVVTDLGRPAVHWLGSRTCKPLSRPKRNAANGGGRPKKGPEASQPLPGPSGHQQRTTSKKSRAEDKQPAAEEEESGREEEVAMEIAE
ncbi:unnamed protein product [Heterotrigona itama]|uniref:Uncharacterized protein n=1 Tax=Heterotrigona itama TaxID=395501 RepID=A0A6V7H7E5_9HYME|nr:unnamed protein product [Heterotrigona itama]